jgi:hypothetical protein
MLLFPRSSHRDRTPMETKQTAEAAHNLFGHFESSPEVLPTIRYWRCFGAGLIAAVLCVAQVAPASAGCVLLAGTADGFDRETAVDRAQLALKDYVHQYKSENHLDAVTVTAMRAEPKPYWRSEVSANMMRGPDVVTQDSYTVCWQGVISTDVCTSGARVCW